MAYKKYIFSTFLDLLQVKHTKFFSSKLFEEHPHKNNLFGLSSMLSTYNIDNVAISLVKNKEVFSDIETPFFAYVGNSFVIVYNITSNGVNFYWNEEKVSVSMEEFLNLWSGVVLLAEVNENSIEPGYYSNRRKEFFHISKKILLFFALIFLFGIIGFTQKTYTHTGLLTSILINSIGVYISYLLLLKQMHIHSNPADKICSLFLKQGDCNSILDTKASTFFGVFSWSEIGLGYFTANILIILCLPSLYPYLAVVNILSLPYTIWSIWYQAKVKKQWCVLCMIVQALLWLLFANNLFFEFFEIHQLEITNILLIGCLYIIPIFALNLMTSHFIDSKKLSIVTQQLNSLKANEAAFKSILQQQSHYVTDRTIGLFWGNREAKNTLTIITNPHCSPCVRAHKRLEKLLAKTQNGYCIQYILSSFNEELEESNRLFIAMYQQKKEEDFLGFLDDWYKNEKINPNGYCKKYNFDNNDKLIKEHMEQKKWLKETSIQETPTILFNGYEVSKIYEIEDLVFFKENNII